MNTLTNLVKDLTNEQAKKVADEWDMHLTASHAVFRSYQIIE